MLMLTPPPSKMCNVKTKFITGTKIDIAKALKELILLDTGANGRFSCNLRWVHNLKYFPKPQYAIVGYEFKCMVYGIGYCLLPTNDGRIKPFPVKYAPSLPNAFSCADAPPDVTEWQSLD